MCPPPFGTPIQPACWPLASVWGATCAQLNWVFCMRLTWMLQSSLNIERLFDSQKMRFRVASLSLGRHTVAVTFIAICRHCYCWCYYCCRSCPHRFLLLSMSDCSRKWHLTVWLRFMLARDATQIIPHWLQFICDFGTWLFCLLTPSIEPIPLPSDGKTSSASSFNSCRLRLFITWPRQSGSLA